MINDTTKSVTLSDINPSRLSEFTLDSVYGRDAIAEQIEKDIEEFSRLAYLDGPRSHLGASVIGHECQRYLWFAFRWMGFEKKDGRQARLLRRGHSEEDKIIELLRGIGLTIKQTEDDGKQIRITTVGKHFGGSCDGKGLLPTRYGLPDCPLLLEFKTASGKNFQPVKNSGVIKSKPEHFTQMCVYGVKLNLQYALYIAVNKDDDDLDIELIELDWELGNKELAKADAIIHSYNPPARMSEDASFYKCKWCCMNAVCHLNALPEKNCRSCKYAQPVEDAQWKCWHHNSIIPKEFLINGCASWDALPH